MRSATAPDIIVVAVPANPIWKMKNAIRKAPAVSEKKRSEEPNQPPTVSPNMRANPKAQKTAAVSAKSAKFLAATLTLFFVRTLPLSNEEKPACMNITRAAATRIQAISSASAVDTSSPVAREVVRLLKYESGCTRAVPCIALVGCTTVEAKAQSGSASQGRASTR